jgi:hypothetical protein
LQWKIGWSSPGDLRMKGGDIKRISLHRSGAKPNETAGSVAKLEWRGGKLYPRVHFIVTNMAHLAENVVAVRIKRSTCAQNRRISPSGWSISSA